MEEIHDRVLLGHVKKQTIKTIYANSWSKVTWIDRGEIIAGSYCMSLMPHGHDFTTKVKFEPSDIDIYFKSSQDAVDFAQINKLSITKELPAMGIHIELCSRKVNLIWGIPFNSPEDIINGFDIRACAIAYDPKSEHFIYVDGAIEDTLQGQIVFQTSARSVSIARLIKYSHRNFTVDRYQKVILAEMIKGGFHDPEVELKATYVT
jgi:hypothetical protein